VKQENGLAKPSQDGVEVTGRYSNRQITQLAARLLDIALIQL
jgi:hypothetical protein